MRPPTGLLGLGVLLWGWQSGLLIAAVPMVLAIEASRWLSVRFEFDFADFRRIADLCLWVLAAIVAYAVLDRGLPHAVVMVVELLPFAGVPLVVAQRFSTTAALDLGALFRLGDNDEQVTDSQALNPGYPFFAVCLLSAAAANSRSVLFYPAAVLLVLWALSHARSKRYTLSSWLVLVVVAAGLGYAGHLTLRATQIAIIEKTGDWLAGGGTDPYQSTTDIGHLGELKLSDRILVRVTNAMHVPGRLLLHRASYNRYAGGTWLAQSHPLNTRAVPANSRHRPLFSVSPTTPERRVTITSQLSRGKAVLSLPGGTVAVAHLAVSRLQSNGLGTVRVEADAPFISYDARYVGNAIHMAPPDEHDLKVPRSEAPAIKRIVTELDLSSLPTAQRIERIAAYFDDDFGYSLYQSGQSLGATPVADFLERTRAGHCEYFATASVLLLRAAGIPARYATGYSAQEWSELEQAYVVRQRHAHAWARYYLNGSWHDLDTTPATWANIEAEQASWLEPAADLWSWLRFRFENWQAGKNRIATSPWWFLLLGPLIAYVVWRLRMGKRQRLQRLRDDLNTGSPETPVSDSAFARIEQRFLTPGWARNTREPLTAWLARLHEAKALPADACVELSEVIHLYYRYRFDPAADRTTERSALEATVDSWLRDHGNSVNGLNAQTTQRS